MSIGYWSIYMYSMYNCANLRASDFLLGLLSISSTCVIGLTIHLLPYLTSVVWTWTYVDSSPRILWASKSWLVLIFYPHCKPHVLPIILTNCEPHVLPILTRRASFFFFPGIRTICEFHILPTILTICKLLVLPTIFLHICEPLFHPTILTTYLPASFPPNYSNPLRASCRPN